MAWIQTIEPDRAEGALDAAYEAIGPSARAANVVRLHSLHPGAMLAHIGLYKTLMFEDSPLSRAQRETIAVVVSGINGCHY